MSCFISRLMGGLINPLHNHNALTFGPAYRFVSNPSLSCIYGWVNPDCAEQSLYVIMYFRELVLNI